MLGVDAFIAATQSLTRREELVGHLSETVRNEGYDNVVIARVANGEISELLANVLPDGYAATYMDENWARIDPILSLTQRATRAFYWNDAIKGMRPTKQQCGFLKDCKTLGVQNGFTLPFHGPSRSHDVVSISMREDQAVDPLRGPLIQAMAVQTWVRLNAIDRPLSEPGLPKAQLSEREIEILRWCRDGKSYWTIGAIIGISEKTVAYHMANIFKKLSVSNRTSAIITAIQLDLLEL